MIIGVLKTKQNITLMLTWTVYWGRNDARPSFICRNHVHNRSVVK